MAVTVAPQPARARTRVRALRLPLLAAALSLSAAVAHAQGVVPIAQSWWVYGAAFAAIAAAQAALAVLVLVRPRASWVALAGIAGNLAVIGGYVFSRTNGLPVGPYEGLPEDPGPIDLVTLANEVALVAVLLAMLHGGTRRWGVRLVVLAGVALWLARATGVVVA